MDALSRLPHLQLYSGGLTGIIDNVRPRMSRAWVIFRLIMLVAGGVIAVVVQAFFSTSWLSLLIGAAVAMAGMLKPAAGPLVGQLRRPVSPPSPTVRGGDPGPVGTLTSIVRTRRPKSVAVVIDHWPFHDREAGHSSGKSVPLGLSGGARCAGGVHGGLALSVDGSGGWASSIRPVVRTDGCFTFMAWVCIGDVSQSRAVASQGDGAVSGFSLRYSQPDGKWALSMTCGDPATGTAIRVMSSSPPVPGAWVHLAGICDVAAGRIVLYVNGTPEGTASFSSVPPVPGVEATPQPGRGLRLARGPQGASAEFFDGAIDEVRVFSRALTADEIVLAATLPGMQASFAMDEMAGDTAADQLGGREHTLHLHGAEWGGAPGSGLTFPWRDGEKMTWCQSTGSIVTPDESFSVSAWVLLNDTGHWRTAVSQDGSDVSSFYLQFERDQRSWSFGMYAADSHLGRAGRAMDPLPARLGVWVHLAGVHDATGRQLLLYVDGRQASTAFFAPSGWPASGSFAVGSFAVGRALWDGEWADGFNGSVRQVRVWCRALTDADVSVLASGAH